MYSRLMSICCIVFFGVLFNVAELNSADKSKPGLEVTIERKPVTCEVESAVGDRVEIHYIGKLKNGKVFDSSIKKNPIAFTLGAGQVIEGWDKGLRGMCVGEKRHLVIPPSMGYGDPGFPPVIPGRATLYFEVEMIYLEKGKHIIFISSFSSLVNLITLPTIVVVVIGIMYYKYKKELDKKKAKKRR